MYIFCFLTSQIKYLLKESTITPMAIQISVDWFQLCIMINCFVSQLYVSQLVEAVIKYHSLLHAHLEAPVIIIEQVQSHLRPVNWNNLTLSGVTYCRHLEWEKVLTCILSVELLTIIESTGAWVNFESVVIRQEFTVESSYDHDLFFAELAHACSLSGGDWKWRVHVEWVVTHVDLFPSSCGDCAHAELEPFNGVGVFLTGVLNSTEDVDEVVLKVSTWMVMTPLINGLKLKPVILVRIIQFNLLRSWTHFFSRAWHHDVCVGNIAAGVSMSSILHTGLVLKVHLEGWLVEWTDKLSALEHAVGQSLVITSSDHVNFWVLMTQLNHLEIVWEVASEVNGSVSEFSWRHVQDSNGLWVLLEDVKLLWELASFSDLHYRSHVIELLSDGHSSILHHGGMVDWLKLIVITTILLDFLSFFATLDMLQHWFIIHVLWASRAIELKKCDEVLELSMHVNWLRPFTANRTWPAR